MKGDCLPHADHVVRHCPPTAVSEEGKIQASAFMLRPQIDEFLSVNWLEHLGCESHEVAISELRRVFERKNYSLRRRARFAILRVGKILDYVKTETNDVHILKVLHEPNDIDLSHSGIYGMEEENQLIAELLCEIIEDKDVYPAVL